MPVLSDTARSSAVLISGPATSVSIDLELNVSTALEDSCLLVGVAILAGVNVASTAWSVMFNGDALTPVSGASAAWISSHRVMKGFALQNVDVGRHTLTVTATGIPAETLPRAVLVVAETCGGVASVGAATVVNTQASTSANAVTVASESAANRVIGLHCTAGTLAAFSGAYSGGQQRSAAVMPLFGQLVLGDGPGAPSVTLSAVQGITPLGGANTDWAAIGFNLTPAVVHLDAAATVSEHNAITNMSVYKPRQADKSSRYWIIPGPEPAITSGWPPKDPSDSAICLFDWTPDLADDETITTADFTASRRLTIDDSGIDGKKAWVRVSGGDPGGAYPVDCKIDTTADQTLNATEYLIVEHRKS